MREEAARAHNQRTAEYLLGMPLVADFLEEGLSMLGYSCEEFEIERLWPGCHELTPSAAGRAAGGRS